MSRELFGAGCRETVVRSDLPTKGTTRGVGTERSEGKWSNSGPSRGRSTGGRHHRQVDQRGPHRDNRGRAFRQDTHQRRLRVVDGRVFVLHTAYGRAGDLPGGGIEIIGHDAASGGYVSRFFDSQGNVSTHELSVEGDTWSWWGESTRCTAMFTDE